MDIRVIGGGAAALAFGAAGFNYVGMEEVLSADLLHVDSVAAQDLQTYMDGVVAEFSTAYDYMGFEGEDYVFVGDISFSADAATKTFEEITRSEDALTKADRKQVKADLIESDYCASEDALLFTEKGYNYSVTIYDGKNILIMHEVCRPLRRAGSV